MSLDDLVQIGRKKGPQGKFSRANQGGAQKTGKFQQSQNQNGKGVGETGGVDLRDILAKKQKSTIGDLRSKLKPKALYTSKYSKSQPTTPQSFAKSPSSTPRRAGQSSRGHPITPMKPIRVDSSPSPPPPSRPPRRSDPGPISHKQRGGAPSKLPSYDEAKKITVTVPGLRHPPSSSEVSPTKFKVYCQIFSTLRAHLVQIEACVGFFVLFHFVCAHVIKCLYTTWQGARDDDSAISN